LTASSERTCEAELVLDEGGGVVYAYLLPGWAGLPMCGKPAVEKQDSLFPAFDEKFPPRRLCAEHWDAWVRLMRRAKESAQNERLKNKS
jgi:hypothetical protein